MAYCLKVIKSIPLVRHIVDREIQKAGQEIWDSVTKDGIPADDPALHALPQQVSHCIAPGAMPVFCLWLRAVLTQLPPLQGFPKQKLLEWLSVKASRTSESTKPGKSKISGAVYFSDNEDHAALLQASYNAFSTSNPLHADAYPSVRRYAALG